MYIKKIILLIFIIFILPYNALGYQETETLILLDASISMRGSYRGPKESKIEVAADVIRNILQEFPAQKSIGLRVFGFPLPTSHIPSSGNNDLCHSSKLLSGIAPYNVQNITYHLDQIHPYGVTPLTYGLQQAIENDFSNSSFKHIIIITDGGENCNVDPCQFIKSIMETRNDIKIDIITIEKVYGKELTELNCLVNSTNGEIHTISSKIDFQETFAKILLPKTNSEQRIKSKLDVETKIEIENLLKKELSQIKYKNFLLEE